MAATPGVSLVLEGGGMRGAYTSGALDANMLGEYAR